MPLCLVYKVDACLFFLRGSKGKGVTRTLRRGGWRRGGLIKKWEKVKRRAQEAGDAHSDGAEQAEAGGQRRIKEENNTPDFCCC